MGTSTLADPFFILSARNIVRVYRKTCVLVTERRSPSASNFALDAKHLFSSSAITIRLTNIPIHHIKVRRILVALKIQNTLPLLLIIQIMQIKRIVVRRGTHIGTMSGSLAASPSVSYGDGAVVVVARVLGVECHAVAAEVLLVDYRLTRS